MSEKGTEHTEQQKDTQKCIIRESWADTKIESQLLQATTAKVARKA